MTAHRPLAGPKGTNEPFWMIFLISQNGSLFHEPPRHGAAHVVPAHILAADVLAADVLAADVLAAGPSAAVPPWSSPSRAPSITRAPRRTRRSPRSRRAPARRTDGYGGPSVTERATFVAEVAQAVREATGPGFVISVRISQWKESAWASTST
jgi:hypothetical protein